MQLQWRGRRQQTTDNRRLAPKGHCNLQILCTLDGVLDFVVLRKFCGRMHQNSKPNALAVIHATMKTASFTTHASSPARVESGRSSPLDHPVSLHSIFSAFCFLLCFAIWCINWREVNRDGGGVFMLYPRGITLSAVRCPRPPSLRDDEIPQCAI